MMQHFSAEPAASERAEADGEKSESHVGALLFRGRELGNIFVILGRLGDLAQGEDENGDHRSPIAGPPSNDQPRKCGDESAENHGTKGRDLSNEVIPGQGETDHYRGVDAEYAFDTGVGINEVVNIAGQQGELLPKNDPVAGKDQKKEHELRIG